MKLFDGGRAPNPRRVRIYMAEKGLAVPLAPVDMAALAHKAPEMTARNPLQRLPVLELDDGTVICESIAICRYFEALHPEPNLFGADPLEIAVIEMWQRRLELNLFLAVAAAFRHTHQAMADWEIPQMPPWGELNRQKAADFLGFLDGHLATSRFAAGPRFTVADITGLVALDFMKPAKIAVPDHLVHVRRWHDELKSRPSASA